jgi:hypothetical protein
LKERGRPVIDIPLTPEELLSEASRIRAMSRVHAEDVWIRVDLKEGEAKHWAHVEGEVVIEMDKLYRPSRF